MKCQKSAFIWCISPQSCTKRTVRQTIRFFYLVRGKSPPALLFAPKSRCASWGKYAATPSLRVPIGKGQIKGIRNPKASHAPPEIRQFTMSVPWRASVSLNATR